jgi:urea transport system ATP-binding protein
MHEQPTAAGHETLPGGIVTPHNWILYLDKISVSFDGFRALNNLNLYIERGELRCIIGANGAGKTTMMDVITGKTRPDEGEAFFAGTVDLLAHDEPEIASWIGRKFQKPTVFVNHTVLENLELAGMRDKRVWPALIKRTTRRSATASTRRCGRSASSRTRSVPRVLWRTARSSGSRSACC